MDQLAVRWGEFIPSDLIELPSLGEIVLQEFAGHMPHKCRGGEMHGHTDPFLWTEASRIPANQFNRGCWDRGGAGSKVRGNEREIRV